MKHCFKKWVSKIPELLNHFSRQSYKLTTPKTYTILCTIVNFSPLNNNKMYRDISEVKAAFLIHDICLIIDDSATPFTAVCLQALFTQDIFKHNFDIAIKIYFDFSQ